MMNGYNKDPNVEFGKMFARYGLIFLGVLVAIAAKLTIGIGLILLFAAAVRILIRGRMAAKGDIARSTAKCKDERFNGTTFYEDVERFELERAEANAKAAEKEAGNAPAEDTEKEI